MIPSLLLYLSAFLSCALCVLDPGQYTGPSPWPNRNYTLDRRVFTRMRAARGSFQFWSTKRNYYGCVMPKVGCSSWLLYVREMELKQHKGGAGKYKRGSFENKQFFFRSRDNITEYRDSALTEILNDQSYFKFAVVRHPWDRLVSAFRSKYEGECHMGRECFQAHFWVPIDITKKEPLTFHEFVVALAEKFRQNVNKVNVHFRPQHMLCELDSIPYDYIVDLLDPEHTDFVSKKMGFNVTFREATRERYEKTRSEGYYKGRTRTVHHCTLETVALAAELYRVDAKLLGYSFDRAYESCAKYGTTSPPPDAIRSIDAIAEKVAQKKKDAAAIEVSSSSAAVGGAEYYKQRANKFSDEEAEYLDEMECEFPDHC
eukprot:m.99011 g.99011  ORF g.99011 m.99011 type:complete len:372 (+) comp22148_c0_seq1:69-1184(+)